VEPELPSKGRAIFAVLPLQGNGCTLMLMFGLMMFSVCAGETSPSLRAYPYLRPDLWRKLGVWPASGMFGDTGCA